MTPKQRARADIDRLRSLAGWEVQDFKQTDIHAAKGVAIAPKHGKVICDAACGTDRLIAADLQPADEGGAT